MKRFRYNLPKIKFLRPKKIILIKSIIIVFAILGFLSIINRFENGIKNTIAYADQTYVFDQVLGIQTTSVFDPTTTVSESASNIQISLGNYDKRAYILDQYFKSYNSPLYGYGQIFVNACDKYGAPKDCTTVAAIARNETMLCTYHNSAQMHNCWGFGGGGVHRQSFDSFEQAIDKVTDVLVNQYGVVYMQDPSKMEKIFCGTQDECIGWGGKIKLFMNEINAYSIQLNQGPLL